jgi:hypothetical protein
LTLTHHATDLILPGGANITTAAGDEAEFIEYAAGDYRCTSYSKASGEPVVAAGGVTPVFSAQKVGNITVIHGSTICILDTEVVDSDNAYSTSTGKFTPQTAGYYYVSCACVHSTANNKTSCDLQIHFNGTTSKVSSNITHSASNILGYESHSCFGAIYFNGSTDYVQMRFSLYNYTTNGSRTIQNSWFNGFLIKAD